MSTSSSPARRAAHGHLWLEIGCCYQMNPQTPHWLEPAGMVFRMLMTITECPTLERRGADVTARPRLRTPPTGRLPPEPPHSWTDASSQASVADRPSHVSLCCSGHSLSQLNMTEPERAGAGHTHRRTELEGNRTVRQATSRRRGPHPRPRSERLLWTIPVPHPNPYCQ